MANDLARSLAYDVFMKRFDAPTYVSLSTAFNMLNVMATDSWQRKWDYEPTGHFTRQLIPSVGSKIVFPDSRDIGISYCRLLLHDTLLHDDSYRTGTTDTPLCSCGKNRETSDHVHVGRTEKLQIISCWDAVNTMIRELSCYNSFTMFGHQSNAKEVLKSLKVLFYDICGIHNYERTTKILNGNCHQGSWLSRGDCGNRPSDCARPSARPLAAYLNMVIG